jgi:hypothetical protein
MTQLASHTMAIASYSYIYAVTIKLNSKQHLESGVLGEILYDIILTMD